MGVDWSFENGGSIGRRLNLNNMGSIGSRMEEQDYLEIAPAFRFNTKPGDSTLIYAQMKLAVYSTSLSSFALGNTLFTAKRDGNNPVVSTLKSTIAPMCASQAAWIIV